MIVGSTPSVGTRLINTRIISSFNFVLDISFDEEENQLALFEEKDIRKINNNFGKLYRIN